MVGEYEPSPPFPHIFEKLFLHEVVKTVVRLVKKKKTIKIDFERSDFQPFPQKSPRVQVF